VFLRGHLAIFLQYATFASQLFASPGDVLNSRSKHGFLVYIQRGTGKVEPNSLRKIFATVVVLLVQTKN